MMAQSSGACRKQNNKIKGEGESTVNGIWKQAKYPWNISTQTHHQSKSKMKKNKIVDSSDTAAKKSASGLWGSMGKEERQARNKVGQDGVRVGFGQDTWQG